MDNNKMTVDGKERFERDNYDPHIVPSETAARIEREKDGYKQEPVKEGDLDTTGGYTVDNEGLANNYAIEPEMYYEERGDLQEKQKAEAQRREQELVEINQTDEDNKLTMKEDQRGKGTGAI